MSEEAFDAALFWFLRIGMYAAMVAFVATLVWGFLYGWE